MQDLYYCLDDGERNVEGRDLDWGKEEAYTNTRVHLRWEGSSPSNQKEFFASSMTKPSIF